MNDYSENYLKIQRLMKQYYSATTKCNYNVATKIAHQLADESIRLEISTIKELKDQWLKS
jgi:hypothetical protein